MTPVYLFSDDEKTIQIIEKHKDNINKLTFSSTVYCNERTSSNQKFVAESVANHLCSFGILTRVPVVEKPVKLNKKKLEYLQIKLESLLTQVSKEKYVQRASEDIKIKDREKVIIIKIAEMKDNSSMVLTCISDPSVRIGNCCNKKYKIKK